VLYDASTQQYLIAYTTGNNAIAMQHGSTLLAWSGPIASGAITDSTNSEDDVVIIGRRDGRITLVVSGAGDNAIHHVTFAHSTDCPYFVRRPTWYHALVVESERDLYDHAG
jgi:hypothetical protein